MDVTTEWFWEGNVVNALAAHLQQDHWNIERIADTASKAPGVDLVASRSGELLLVEVKGYPSTTYRAPERSAEKKRTNPASQAGQWFSHALLTALRLQSKNPSALVAIGFPDVKRYRTLFAETRPGLSKLAVIVFFVDERGSVERLA